MTMPLKTYQQLRKLMMLTHSDNDTEALAALRKANALLREHSYDWNSAFDRLVKVESPIEMAYVHYDTGEKAISPAYKRNDPDTLRINNAFEEIEDRDPRGSFADFIASLKDQWDRSGRLTVAQKEALFRAVGQ